MTCWPADTSELVICSDVTGRTDPDPLHRPLDLRQLQHVDGPLDLVFRGARLKPADQVRRLPAEDDAEDDGRHHQDQD